MSFSCTLLAAIYHVYLRHLKIIELHRCFGGEAKAEISKTRARTRGEMKRSCSPRALYKRFPKKLSPSVARS